MADFSSVVITEQGKSLLAKVEAEKDILTFTIIKTSDITYKKENLYKLEDIENSKQIRNITSVIYENPNQVKISCRLSNEDVIDTGYNLACYGIYAKSKKYTNEILFAAASVDDINNADWISPAGSLNAITINLNTILIISNVEVSQVVISDDGVSTETFNEHVMSKGDASVHGATSQAEPNMIIARDGNGVAHVLYPLSPNNTTIVNKEALDNAIKNAEVPRGTLINYYTKGVQYKVNEYIAIDDENPNIPEYVEPTQPTTPTEPTEPEEPEAVI